MAEYKVEWKRSAVKELEKLPRQAVPHIVEAVRNLTSDPFPFGTRKLAGSEQTYRIRVGVYRILYSVHVDIFIVEIIRVRHRKDVYKRRK
jgi:mRNA interferase RelE/StbE